MARAAARSVPHARGLLLLLLMAGFVTNRGVRGKATVGYLDTKAKVCDTLLDYSSDERKPARVDQQHIVGTVPPVVSRLLASNQTLVGALPSGRR